MISRSHQITINGRRMRGRSGALLLDEALRNGIDLPYDCRAGHCGACCVRLASGQVLGGKGTEPDIVHACQCRIVGDAVFETCKPSGIRTVDGVLSSLRALSADVLEVGIETSRALPHHAGQYVKVCFKGYPGRSYSLTHPLRDCAPGPLAWLHIRRLKDGLVTQSLGKTIKPGHRVTLTGPYGSAYFRPNQNGRLIVVATSTGFAPIWSIAVAALRENPGRRMMVIAGGRNIESLYMGPALARLAHFPNVMVVPVCSSTHASINGIRPGRPTDYMPQLLPTDVVYACGAPGMVDAVKSIATSFGAVCYADPFVPAGDDTGRRRVFRRAKRWLSTSGRSTAKADRNGFTIGREFPPQPGMATSRVGSNHHFENA